MPLCLVVSTDGDNRTRLLAQALILNEREDSIAFVLNGFKDLYDGKQAEVGEGCERLLRLISA